MPKRPASSCQARSYIDYNDSQIPKWSKNHDHRVQCCNTLLVSKCLKNFNWAQHILYHCSNIWRALVSHRRQRGCASTFFINCPDMSRKRHKQKHQQKLLRLSQSIFFIKFGSAKNRIPVSGGSTRPPLFGHTRGHSKTTQLPAEVSHFQSRRLASRVRYPPFFGETPHSDAIYAWPLGKWEFFGTFLNF